MHHCWRINEILTEIAEFLCVDPDEKKALPAAARLARCSKLYEPVLDVIWARKQTSFVTLLKCLPQHLLDFSDHQSIETLVSQDFCYF